MSDVEIGTLYEQKIYMSLADLKEIANKAVLEENRTLRQALEEIRQTVSNAQDTTGLFHFELDSKDGKFILETAENALKGNENG